jgi:hypothetical protein
VYTEKELRKIKHDLRRPFSNLQMLVTILKGSDMDKAKLIDNLEKVISEGNQALELLDRAGDK